MSKILVETGNVTVGNRGRVAVRNPELLAAMKALKPGQRLNLSGLYGTVEKAKRQTIGAEIRAHWSEVRKDKCRIGFGNGYPEVAVKG